MAAELPAYSGPGGRCPKCGVDGIQTEWHDSSKWASGYQKVRAAPPVTTLAATKPSTSAGAAGTAATAGRKPAQMAATIKDRISRSCKI
jgi:hypothetical protein